MRATARDIFSAALQTASITSAFSRHLHCERGVLRICEDLYDLDSYSRVFVVSIGKAAHTMATALEAQVGSRLEGIVASSVAPASQLHGFRYFQGGHPTPTAESIRAAEAILKALSSLDSASLVIFMLSGGGSSIVEKPIDDEISLVDLVTTYQELVHSGAPIADINAIRKHLSSVKGGRLAQAAYPAQQVSILVSDVPDATPDALASGPTMPDSTSIHDCERIAARYNLPSCALAGGLYFLTSLRSMRPPPLPAAQALPWKWITPAMTGTTRKPPPTCSIACANYAARSPAFAYSPEGR